MTAAGKTTARSLLFCVLAQIAGCGGSGEGLDANGRPIGSGGDGGELTPDLASIQANVFTPICTQCHIGANAPQGLRLDEANSYGALVGVPSSEQPSVLRVNPGDSENSYLVHKIEGRAAVGARMPLDQPPLPNATILVIRQWIDSGASSGTAVGASAKPLVVQTVSVSANSVSVAMSHAVDASLVNAATVTLERVDTSSVEASAIKAVARVSPHNESLILLEPAAPLAAGQYRLTLRGTGPAALADWNALIVDGDGDGDAGGDYVQAFSVGGEP